MVGGSDVYKASCVLGAVSSPGSRVQTHAAHSQVRKAPPAAGDPGLVLTLGPRFTVSQEKDSSSCGDSFPLARGLSILTHVV